MYNLAKRHIPPSIKRHLIPFIELYRLTHFHRNRVVHLGGRLAGYSVHGGKLSGFEDGTYESDLCTIVEANVKPGMTCVDVGAHIGYMTLLFAKLVDQRGRVFAFEAHPVNAKYLQKSIALNNLSDIVVVENMAVTDGILPTVMLTHGRMHRSAEWRVQRDADRTGKPVRAISLDQYFTDDTAVDFIKMDIEGAEEQALPGAQNLLVNQRPLICIEFHNDAAWARRDILTDNQYRLYDIQNHNWDIESSSQRVYHCLAVPKEKLHEFREHV